MNQFKDVFLGKEKRSYYTAPFLFKNVFVQAASIMILIMLALPNAI